MKLNKIMAIFLVVLFVSCIALTAFASEQPLFLPEPEGILPAPATTFDGQNNTVISGGNYSNNGSGVISAARLTARRPAAEHLSHLWRRKQA